MASSSPRRGSQPQPKRAKTAIAILSQERVKLRTSNLTGVFTGPFEQKPIKNFREKGAWADPRTSQILGVQPIISGPGKGTNFKFYVHIHRIDRNKSPLKISGKVAVGIVRNSRKLLRHPHMGHITRSSL